MVAIGVLVIFLLLSTAVFGPVVLPLHPTIMHRDNLLSGPSPVFLFGTDNFGRDIFSRVIYGMRISFEVGAASLILGGGMGVATGLIAGYFGGIADALIIADGRPIVSVTDLALQLSGTRCEDLEQLWAGSPRRKQFARGTGHS